MKIKKIIIYLVLAVLSLIAGIYSPSLYKEEENLDFLKTSMFEIMSGALENANKTLDKAVFDSADLSLENVVLRKEDEKYEIIFKIKNNGPYFKNLKVMMSNDLTKDFLIIKNGDNGLTLKEGEELISREFVFSPDEKFSGAEFNFNIKVLNDEVFETNTDNNIYKTSIHEFSSSVDDFYLESIGKDGSLGLDYRLNDFIIKERSFELLVSDRLKYNPIDVKYRESYIDSKIVPYREIPLTKSVFESGNFKIVDIQNGFPAFIKLFDDIFTNTEKSYFLILKINFDTNMSKRYKLSNVLEFKPIDYVSKKQFSAYIQNVSGFEPDLSVFEGIDISRGEAIKYLFEYFEIDVGKLQSKKIFFKDIRPTHQLYKYAQALKKYNFASGLSEYFLPEEKLSRDFLYLFLHESTKNY